MYSLQNEQPINTLNTVSLSCIHCGRMFSSLQGLRIHDASHRRNNNKNISIPNRMKLENSTRDMERFKINSEIQKISTLQEDKKLAVERIREHMFKKQLENNGGIPFDTIFKNEVDEEKESPTISNYSIMISSR
jgi:hypothetical protein